MIVVNKDLGSYLEEALDSIVSQNYPNLELIVVDGGSTDNSVDVIRSYEKAIHWWVSESDPGQYHALQKGFEQSSGEIMGWLNSDDKLMPRSLFQIAHVFGTFSEVDWIQGHPMEYTPEGGPLTRISIPWARWSKYRYLTYDFQFIQQESTFWRRTLWEKAGGTLDFEYRVAGDMELWARFFRHAKLYTCLLALGGFRHRSEEQTSKKHRDRYMDEATRIIQRERARYPLWRRISFSCMRFFYFPLGVLFFYDIPILKKFYRNLYRLPHLISYDLDHHKYSFYGRRVIHPPLFWKGKQVRRKPVDPDKS